MIRRLTAIVMAMILTLAVACPALAVSAKPASFLATTQNGVYFELDGALIRVDGDVAAKVAEGSIASVVTVGETAYCLQ